MTFEHGHENKSCSACRERVNESVKVLKVAKVKDFESERATFERVNESVKVLKVAKVKDFESERATFEHRHEKRS